MARREIAIYNIFRRTENASVRSFFHCGTYIDLCIPIYTYVYVCIVHTYIFTYIHVIYTTKTDLMLADDIISATPMNLEQKILLRMTDFLIAVRVLPKI